MQVGFSTEQRWRDWFIILPGFLLLPVKILCIYLELEARPRNKAVQVMYLQLYSCIHATQYWWRLCTSLTDYCHLTQLPDTSTGACVGACVRVCACVLLSCHCIPVPLTQIGDLLADNNLIIMTMILLCREYICGGSLYIYSITQHCDAQIMWEYTLRHVGATSSIPLQHP